MISIATALIGALGLLIGTLATALVTRRGQDVTAGSTLIGQLMERVDRQEERIAALEADHREQAATLLDFSVYVTRLWALLTGVAIPAPPPRTEPYLPALPRVADPGQSPA